MERTNSREKKDLSYFKAKLSDNNEPILVHGRQVAKLASAIAQAMAYSDKKIDLVCRAAIVHDAGKFLLPAEILNKPGPLDEQERLLIKMHPEWGYQLLQKLEFDPVVVRVALEHHERLNGSGYPLGLRDKDISPITKIISVADVMIAMASTQVYRPALTTEQVLNELKQNSGLLYDSKIVAVCLALIEKFNV